MKKLFLLATVALLSSGAVFAGGKECGGKEKSRCKKSEKTAKKDCKKDCKKECKKEEKETKNATA
ncbi:MAG: hypothetical protein ACOVQE_05950 [Chitinophagaceae bacterium]